MDGAGPIRYRKNIIFVLTTILEDLFTSECSSSIFLKNHEQNNNYWPRTELELLSNCNQRLNILRSFNKDLVLQSFQR
jgi:hypothetical protein